MPKNGGWPCTKIKIEGEENLVPFLTETGVLEELLDLQRNVAAETESFLLNTTTNLVDVGMY